MNTSSITRWTRVLIGVVFCYVAQAGAVPRACTDYYRSLKLSKKPPTLQITITRDGLKVSALLKCLGLPRSKTDVLHKKTGVTTTDDLKLRKGMSLLIMPATPKRPRRWQLRYRYSRGGVTSSLLDRKYNFSSHYLEFGTSLNLSQRWDLSLMGGLKSSSVTVDLTDSSRRSTVNDLAPVGQLRVQYGLDPRLKLYAVYELDRYLARDSETAATANYLFVARHSLGPGAAIGLTEKLTFVADAQVIAPSAKITSGQRYVAGLSYQFAEFGIGYRYDVLHIKTQSSVDRGALHLLELRYAF